MVSAQARDAFEGQAGIFRAVTSISRARCSVRGPIGHAILPAALIIISPRQQPQCDRTDPSRPRFLLDGGALSRCQFRDFENAAARQQCLRKLSSGCSAARTRRTRSSVPAIS